MLAVVPALFSYCPGSLPGEQAGSWEAKRGGLPSASEGPGHTTAPPNLLLLTWEAAEARRCASRPRATRRPGLLHHGSFHSAVWMPTLCQLPSRCWTHRANTESGAPSLPELPFQGGAHFMSPDTLALQPPRQISFQVTFPLFLWEKGIPFARSAALLLRKRLSPHCPGWRKRLWEREPPRNVSPANKPIHPLPSGALVLPICKGRNQASPYQTCLTKAKRTREPESKFKSAPHIHDHAGPSELKEEHTLLKEGGSQELKATWGQARALSCREDFSSQVCFL